MEVNNMKKMFLILSLTALMSVGLYAEEKNDNNSNVGGSNTPVSNSNIGESFVNALGMGQSAGGGETGAPGSGSGSTSLGVTTNMGSFSSSQTVTNGTPYSYGK